MACAPSPSVVPGLYASPSPASVVTVNGGCLGGGVGGGGGGGGAAGGGDADAVPAVRVLRLPVGENASLRSTVVAWTPEHDTATTKHQRTPTHCMVRNAAAPDALCRHHVRYKKPYDRKHPLSGACDRKHPCACEERPCACEERRARLGKRAPEALTAATAT